MSPKPQKPPQIEYLTAKELAPALGRKPAWLHYHARAADGPIRSTWGETKRKDGSAQGVKLYHVQDAAYYAKGYEVGQNRGKLYPASLIQDRIGTPAELRAIQAGGLTGFVRGLVHKTLEEQARRKRPGLRVVAGGRR